jgi:hypothetical protein
MNAQPQDVQSILRRIEALERQNRRLKQIAAGGLVLLAAVMLSALAVATQRPDFIPAPAQTKAPASATDKWAAYRVTPPENSYARKIEKISTLRGKLDSLANAAEMLRGQVADAKNSIDTLNVEVSLLQSEFDGEHGANDAKFKAVAKTTNENADILNTFTGQVAYLAQQVQLQKQQLDDFRAAACPILRQADVGFLKRIDLDSACGLH